MLPGHAQCGGECGFCHPTLNLPWFPPRNHRPRCYPEIFPFCCIVSGQSGWGVRGPLKPLYPSPAGGTMCPGLRGRQWGLAAVTGLGSQGHAHLCGGAGRWLLAANPAPTAHLSPQGESSQGHRPALGWRTLGARSMLAQLWLFPSLPSCEVSRGNYLGDRLPRLCCHHTKMASFLSHFQVHVSALPLPVCDLSFARSQLSSVNWG